MFTNILGAFTLAFLTLALKFINPLSNAIDTQLNSKLERKMKLERHNREIKLLDLEIDKKSRE
ncbi:hypothetical protein [Kurthia sibirica]|uniref:Uncharacterized protein n=1 Tax=Kurthia sibirica TaxID=202750 RepID=A0A2U3AG64_9BACL|nr:hypothetical protein [Kurthia sibirica]PWI23548.1 hypothetical protein DEX24_16050 [Kurthia sibirica]GEK35401.1 hypothetical protein KSI01_29340 [Kurthia sibirica]